MTRRALRILVPAAALAAAAACAPGHLTPATRVVAEPQQQSRVVTADEIRESGVRNAWDALRLVGRFRLRENHRGEPVLITPTRGRGSLLLDESPLVFLDGVRLADYAVLRQVRANNIEQIEYLNASEGTIRMGTGAVSGAILISTTTIARE